MQRRYRSGTGVTSAFLSFLISLPGFYLIELPHPKYLLAFKTKIAFLN